MVARMLGCPPCDDLGLVEALRWYLPRTVTTLVLRDVCVSVPGLVRLAKELRDVTFLEATSTTAFSPVPSKIRAAATDDDNNAAAAPRELVEWDWDRAEHWPHQERRVHFVFSLVPRDEMQRIRRVFDV